MDRKDKIDAFGVIALTGFALLSGFNQVIIKLVNGGLQPVFFAGVRSLGALLCIWLWMRFRRKSFDFSRRIFVAGIFVGLIFTAEFFCLFLALDYSSVSRTTILYYSMPIWLSLAAHFFLPGDRMSGKKAMGVALAFAGVAIAILDRGDQGGQASLIGDAFAVLAAIGWAGIALCVRVTPISETSPEMQLFYQVAVSGILLTLVAPFFGPLVRDLMPIHLVGLLFQTVVVVTIGFVSWFWLMTIYPASGVASFSFLSPIFGVFFGWAILNEEVGAATIGAILLVAIGIFLINRPRRVRGV